MNQLRCAKQVEVPRKFRGALSIPFWATNTLGYDTVHRDCLIKVCAYVAGCRDSLIDMNSNMGVTQQTGCYVGTLPLRCNFMVSPHKRFSANWL